MTKLGLTSLLILICVSVGHSQTWGCPKEDFKCQVDERRKALDADPRNPERHIDLAMALARAKAHDEIVDKMNSYLRIPNLTARERANGYNQRGLAYLRLRKYDLARADQTKAMEIYPQMKVFFLVNLGLISSEQGKTEQACSDFTAAIAADRTYAKAYAGRADAYQNLGKQDEALQDYTKAIELDPSLGVIYLTRATIYAAKKDYKRALADLDAGIARAPSGEDLVTAYLNRGFVYALMGINDAAVADFTKAIEMSPADVIGYGNRAIVYRKMGKIGLAEADEAKYRSLKSK